MFLFARSLTRGREDAKNGELTVHGTVFAKCARYLCVLLLAASFLFLACEEPKDDFKFELDTNLIGTWTSTYFDSYAITETYLSYGYGADSAEYAGTIRYAVSFSTTAGVIIFKYDEDKKPEYYANYDPATFLPVGDPLPLKGNFIGVYYQDLTPGVSVKIATAYIDGGAEEPSLDAAIEAFTLDKEGGYISHYGTYVK